MAIRFSSDVDRLSITSPLPTNGAWSAVFCFRFIALANGHFHCPMSKDNTANTVWEQIGWTEGGGSGAGNNEVAFFSNVNGPILTGVTLTSGNWYVIGVSFATTASSTVFWYLKDLTAGTAAVQGSGAWASTVTGADKLLVGSDSAAEFFNGEIAAVKVWNKGLSAAELSRECTQRWPALNWGTLFSYWPLASTADKLTDVSGKGDPLTAPGAGSWGDVAGPLLPVNLYANPTLKFVASGVTYTENITDSIFWRDQFPSGLRFPDSTAQLQITKPAGTFSGPIQGIQSPSDSGVVGHNTAAVSGTFPIRYTPDRPLSLKLVVSGTTYTETITDTIVWADSKSDVFTALEARTDTIVWVDSEADHFTAVEARSDTVVWADSEVEVKIYVENPTDSIVWVDSESDHFTAVEARSDTVVWSDSEADHFTAVEARSDTVVWTDSEVEVKVYVEAPTDSIVWADSEVDHFTAVEARSDTIVWADSETDLFTALEALSNTVHWIDSETDAYLYHENLTDTVIWADSETDAVVRLYVEALTDTVVWSDSLGQVFTAIEAPADVVVWADSDASNLLFIETPTDTLVWNDSESEALVGVAFVENLVDTIHISDSKVDVFTARETLSDLIRTQDSLVVSAHLKLSGFVTVQSVVGASIKRVMHLSAGVVCQSTVLGTVELGNASPEMNGPGSFSALTHTESHRQGSASILTIMGSGIQWPLVVNPNSVFATTFTRASDAWLDDDDSIIYDFRVNHSRHTTQGLLLEKSTSNTLLWSRDLTNAAWTKSNMSVDPGSVGKDGYLGTGTILTANSANATALQTVTGAAGTKTASAYLRRLTGTGNVYVTMDGGSTWTDITAMVLVGIWTRISVSQSLSNVTFGFRLATAFDVVFVDFCQLEAGLYSTSAIPTSTVAKSRSPDNYTISTGSWPLYRGAVDLVFTPEWNSADFPGTATLLDARSGAPINGLLIETTGTTISATMYNAGVGVTASAAQNWVKGASYQVQVYYAAGILRLSVNRLLLDQQVALTPAAWPATAALSTNPIDGFVKYLSVHPA